MATNNIFPTGEQQVVRAPQSPLRLPVLRYAGFEQTDGIRSYLFQHISPGEKHRMIAVSADMSLFTQHRVRIQDGPALCLYVLKLAQDAPPSEPLSALRSLTNQYILGYLATLPKSTGKVNGKREKTSPFSA